MRRELCEGDHQHFERFPDFDEYGPVYDHADDNPEISNADIQTWECVLLKSFTYLVKNEFEISVDGEGDQPGQEYF